MMKRARSPNEKPKFGSLVSAVFWLAGSRANHNRILPIMSGDHNLESTGLAKMAQKEWFGQD